MMTFNAWFVITFGGILGWFLLMFLFFLVKLYWEWIEDNETHCPNWLAYLLMVKLGPYTYKQGRYWEKEWSSSYINDWIVFGRPCCVIAGITTITFLSTAQPTLVISIAIILGVSFLFRFVRRLSKKLDRHLTNHK